MSAQMHSGTALATRSAASLDMQLPTATQSSALVRRLVEAGISSILYLRGLFDERCYTEESVGGLTVKHLKKKSSADTHSRTATDAKATRQLDQAATIASWIESACGEPISKKYLRSLTVGISVTPHTPWLIVECYTFHIRYSGSSNSEDTTVVVGAGEDLEQAGIPLVNPNGTLSTTTAATAAKTGPPAAHSRSEVKAITQQLLRRLLVLTQSLPPLPSGRVLSMKLSYYPHTPADYEPPQFCADTEDGSMYRLSGAGEPLSVGQVESEHHSIGVGLLSCIESLARRPEQQYQQQKQKQHQPVSAIETLPSQLAQLTQPTQILPNTQILPLTANNNNCFIDNNSKNARGNEKDIGCACNGQVGTKSTVYVTCPSCSRQLHWLCIGVTPATLHNLGSIHPRPDKLIAAKAAEFQTHGKCIKCSLTPALRDADVKMAGAVLTLWRTVVYSFWKQPSMDLSKASATSRQKAEVLRPVICRMAQGGLLQFESDGIRAAFVDAACAALANPNQKIAKLVFPKGPYQLARSESALTKMLTILSYDHGAAIRETAAFDRDMADVLQKMQVQAQIQLTRNKRRAIEIEGGESAVGLRQMQRCKVSRTQVVITTD